MPKKEKSKEFVFKSKKYQELINDLSFSSFVFNEEIVNQNVRDSIINITFKLKSHNIQPMQFNTDFNGDQKIDYENNLIISSECFLFNLFGGEEYRNNLQNRNNVDEFIKRNIMYRGVVLTKDSKEDKESDDDNAALTKAINCSIRSTDFIEVKNSRLGVKSSSDKNENHLGDQILYKDVEFDVKIQIYGDQLWKNITGVSPNRNKQILECLTVKKDDDVKKLILSLPLKIESDLVMIDFDKVVSVIKNNLIENIPGFSHAGVKAQFKASDFSVSFNNAKEEFKKNLESGE